MRHLSTLQSNPTFLVAFASGQTDNTRLAVYLTLLCLLLVFLATPATRSSQPATRYPSSPFSNTIIVPAYHEASNMRPLVTQVYRALEAYPELGETEILVIDDNSQDGTETVLAEVAKELEKEVRCIVRTHDKGLSSAVITGFKEAKGKNLLVMDADLQHPPSVVPLLLLALTSETPFAIGTRYGEGASIDKDWPLIRRVISTGARALATPLTSTSDPMTGFFALKKQIFLKSQPLNPTGFKIALELMLKARVPTKNIANVPYTFAKRTAGASKLSKKVIVKYVGHLLTLYQWKWGFFFWVILGLLGWVAWMAVLFVGQFVVLRQMGEEVQKLRKSSIKHKV